MSKSSLAGANFGAGAAAATQLICGAAFPACDNAGMKAICLGGGGGGGGDMGAAAAKADEPSILAAKI